MLRLLQDIATDPEEPADDTNPLRQVIVNTHSPSVVMAVPDDSLLLARTTPELQGTERFSKVVFACLPKNWRNRGEPKCPEVSKGELLSFLNPTAVIKQESLRRPRRRKVIDHPELSLFIPTLNHAAA